MTGEQQTETTRPADDDSVTLVVPEPGFVWRIEYTLLIGVAIMLTMFAIAFFYFSSDISNLSSYGYFGVFLINLIGAASILLPSPAAAGTIGGGAFLDDFLGVPAFIWVGLVAGIGEAIGEFSGYAAGYGGRVVVENREQYHKVQRWMERRGTLTLFIVSCVPNPVFDIVGIAAGATRMPIRNFFLAVWTGKTIKNMWLAGLGTLGFSVIRNVL